MSAQEKYFQKTMEKFMSECKCRAAKGYLSCEMRVKKDGELCEESFEILEQKLTELGFEESNVEPFFGEEDAIMLWAEWKLQPPEPENSEKGPKGTSSTCPVCYENQPVVALMPCGHVVCKQCKKSQRFRTCPMCRVNITGATKALFL